MVIETESVTVFILDSLIGNEISNSVGNWLVGRQIHVD